MQDHAVALVLTYAEAGALFEAANLGMNRKAELNMTINLNAVEALKKIARGMGFDPIVAGHLVHLRIPKED